MAIGNPLTRWIYEHSPSFIRDFMTSEYSRRRSQIKYGPIFYQTLVDLERSKYLTNSRIENMQKEKLDHIAWYVDRYVPYYNRLFKKRGFSPSELSSGKLMDLPILEKRDVQENISGLRSTLYRGSKAIEHFQTSGTTGKPLDIYIDRNGLQIYNAHVWHQRSWKNIKLGDSSANFQGYMYTPVNQKKPPFWVHDRIENRLFFSLHHMSHDNLGYYAEALSQYDPNYIMGYPNAIYLMAAYLIENNYKSIRPKAVFTGSETLFNYQREVIEKAFSCQVLDYYGSTEYVCSIMQCEYGNYHVSENFGVVEILNSDGTMTQFGQEGEIVCSGLINHAMVLLRYKIGDKAIPKEGPCPCGRSGKLIEKITGRIDDIIVTPDGRYLSRLDFILKGVVGVKESQIIQRNKNSLEVLVVKHENFSENSKKHIISNLQNRIGREMEYKITEVEEIPRTSSGKFRYVVSDIPFHEYSIRQTGQED